MTTIPVVLRPSHPVGHAIRLLLAGIAWAVCIFLLLLIASIRSGSMDDPTTHPTTTITYER